MISLKLHEANVEVGYMNPETPHTLVQLAESVNTIILFVHPS